MTKLPRIIIASDLEVLAFIEAESLYGSGVGYLDAHLLTSAKLTPGVAIWTRDKTLRLGAEKIGVGLREY